MTAKTTTSTNLTSDLPNGPVAAALVAGGIGSAVTGLMTVLSEASAGIKTFLTWLTPVGPLSGKTGVGVILFLVSWVVLHNLYKGKNVNFEKFAALAFVLLAIGLLFTFPPIFLLFGAH